MTKLTPEESRTLRRFIRSVEDLMDLGAESVGRIADHVGEHGIVEASVDTNVMKSLIAIVDSFR